MTFKPEPEEGYLIARGRFQKYDIVYADPPWEYYGSQEKNAAAGKHYSLMSRREIIDLNVGGLLKPKGGALFLWATCPRLDWAIDAIRGWGLHYRGVAYVWVKTRKDGVPIGARGVTPTFTKPLTELVLVATTNVTGRPFPIHDLKQTQTVFASVQEHSRKPLEVREKIESLCGDKTRIELFARGEVPGWDTWGLEAGPEPDTMCEHKEED